MGPSAVQPLYGHTVSRYTYQCSRDSFLVLLYASVFFACVEDRALVAEGQRAWAIHFFCLSTKRSRDHASSNTWYVSLAGTCCFVIIPQVASEIIRWQYYQQRSSIVQLFSEFRRFLTLLCDKHYCQPTTQHYCALCFQFSCRYNLLIGQVLSYFKLLWAFFNQSCGYLFHVHIRLKKVKFKN